MCWLLVNLAIYLLFTVLILRHYNLRGIPSILYTNEFAHDCQYDSVCENIFMMSLVAQKEKFTQMMSWGNVLCMTHPTTSQSVSSNLMGVQC